MDLWFTGHGQRYHSYPEHSHGYWELLLNLEGTGVLLAEGHAYPFSPGTIFCIRPGIRHSKKSTSGFLDRSILVRDFCFAQSEEPVLVFQDDANASFRTLCQVADHLSATPGSSVYAERCMRSIADALQNLLCFWKDRDQLNPEVARIQFLIHSHITDSDFDLDRIIESTHYSPNHFRTLFRTQCGCSLTQFCNRLRVQLAKQFLLQQELLSVAQVAEKCGFRDPYYFSRVFKQVSGMSPIHFREHSKELDPQRLATDMDPSEYLRSP